MDYTCKWCGDVIRMMVQKGTGACCQAHELALKGDMHLLPAADQAQGIYPPTPVGYEPPTGDPTDC